MTCAVEGSGYIGPRMLNIELPCWRKRGRLQRRFMYAVKDDMERVEVAEEDAREKVRWQ